MEEKKLFIEVPGGRNDFHSAILTSYAFDFHHFEYQVLRSLRQKFITNVAVFVDYRMLDEVIGFTTENLKHLSQSYSVNGIISKGAFHPKINFLVGDNKLLMFLGSGNITPGGHGKNHELFTGFYADSKESSQLPILLEAWTYLQTLVKDIPGYNQERISKIISTNPVLLKTSLIRKHSFYRLDDKIEVALLYNDSSSIFSQIVSLVPKEKIEKITIVSPYYDEKGETLVALQKHYNISDLDVFLPTRFGLPPNKIEVHERINFYSWEETERAKKNISGKNEYFRKLHSKIFHFNSSDFEYCIIGSANATIKGIGDPNRSGVNDEFCVLYRSSEKGLLALLGINGKKIAINPKNLNRDKNSREEANDPADKSSKIFIAGADLSGFQLKVYINNPQTVGSGQISLYDDAGKLIFTDKLLNIDGNFIIKIDSQIRGLNPSSIAITDTNGHIISNRQIINNLDKLFFTDPSKINRNIRQLISAIEVGKVNEFEIIDYYNELNGGKVERPERMGFNHNSVRSESHNPEMNYEQAVEALKNKNNYEKIIKNYSSFQILETIIHLLSSRLEAKENELMDEEEAASSTVSQSRNLNIPHKPTITTTEECERIIKKCDKLSKNYLRLIKNVSLTENHEIDIIDYCEFLLVTHILTAVCYYNVYNVEDKSEPDHFAFKLKQVYLSLMKEILIAFNKLIINTHIKLSSVNDSLSEKRNSLNKRLLYNSLIYIYLIENNTKEFFILQEMELLVLNLYKYLGIPGNDFNQYIIDSSNSNNEIIFSPSGVINLKNKYLKLFLSIDENDKYFWLGHSGFCISLDTNHNIIKYKSVFNINNISRSKLKKYKQLFSK